MKKRLLFSTLLGALVLTPIAGVVHAADDFYFEWDYRSSTDKLYGSAVKRAEYGEQYGKVYAELYRNGQYIDNDDSGEVDFGEEGYAEAKISAYFESDDSAWLTASYKTWDEDHDLVARADDWTDHYYGPDN